MKLINSILILLSISSSLTAILYSKTPFAGDFLLLLIRWSHYTVLSFATLYPFIFNKKYDIYYIIFSVLLFLSWKIFKGECVLSYIEKVYIDKNYKMGQDYLSHPYVDIVAEKHKELVWIVLGLQINIVFVYVIIRHSHLIANPYVKYTIISAAILLFLYCFTYTLKRIKDLTKQYFPKEKQI